MMEKLFNHPTWLKIFSLLLAVLLWLYVMPTYMTEQPKSVDVRLNVIKNANPNLVWMEEDSQPSTVKVSLYGRNYLLTGITKDNFTATLDLNQVTEPNKPGPLEIKLEPVGISRTQYENLSPTVTPKSISVTLMEIKTASVPLVITNRTDQVSVGGVDWAYTASTDVTNVNLTGRSDYLTGVTGVITLDRASLSPDRKVINATVQPVDAGFKPVKLPGVEVQVKLDWRRLPPGKTFRVQPATGGTLGPGLVLGNLEPDPPNARLRAASLDGKLPGQDFVETVPIDVTGRTKTFTVAVKLAPPPGTVVDPTDLTVNVKVNIDEISTEKVFKGVPLTRQGGPKGADVTLGVTDVQIRFQGPYSVINKIDPAVLKAFVDLEGLTPGKHTLPVKVVLPAGVTAVVADPSVVEVSIAVP
ncbi:MAG TPA: CdaR family protein [Symbiobacteriaceae bacterium]|jgi:YbbR domain-containing protein